MAAKKENYTNAELIEIGRKAIETRKRGLESSKKRNAVKSQLYAAFKPGKVELP